MQVGAQVTVRATELHAGVRVVLLDRARALRVRSRLVNPTPGTRNPPR
jgi:hypothetical protein